MARTKSLAKRIAEAPPAADGSAPPVRVLTLTFEQPTPPSRSLTRTYAYTRITTKVALMHADGSDVAERIYKRTAVPCYDGVGTWEPWETWPHAPLAGEDDVAFTYSFDAKDPGSLPLRPTVTLAGYEPSLDTAAAAVDFGKRIAKTLATLDETQGDVASFPEAIARLMAATECTAVAVSTKAFAELTGKPTPAWREEMRFRMASSVPDARRMADDVVDAFRAAYVEKDAQAAE